jgi:hypothetical protein
VLMTSRDTILDLKARMGRSIIGRRRSSSAS